MNTMGDGVSHTSTIISETIIKNGFSRVHQKKYAQLNGLQMCFFLVVAFLLCCMLHFVITYALWCMCNVLACML